MKRESPPRCSASMAAVVVAYAPNCAACASSAGGGRARGGAGQDQSQLASDETTNHQPGITHTPWACMHASPAASASTRPARTHVCLHQAQQRDVQAGQQRAAAALRHRRQQLAQLQGRAGRGRWWRGGHLGRPASRQGPQEMAEAERAAATQGWPLGTAGHRSAALAHRAVRQAQHASKAVQEGPGRQQLAALLLPQLRREGRRQRHGGRREGRAAGQGREAGRRRAVLVCRQSHIGRQPAPAPPFYKQFGNASQRLHASVGRPQAGRKAGRQAGRQAGRRLTRAWPGSLPAAHPTRCRHRPEAPSPQPPAAAAASPASPAPAAP